MKKIFLPTLAAVSMLGMTSCEKDLQTYSTETCRLNFYYNTDNFKYEMTQSSFSFVNAGADVLTDTVWYEVETMGFIRDYDRQIALDQVDTAGVKQAVAGTHYVAFNDPSLAPLYVMPAGKARTKIPVVLRRDASLKKEPVVLKFRIKTNNEFTNGYERYQSRGLEISDMLAKPSAWEEDLIVFWGIYKYPISAYLGKWGPVKHQFMVQTTGKPWDNAYIKELCIGDANFREYIFSKLGKELIKFNAERAAQGLGRLAEEDGTAVTFQRYSGDTE